MKQDGFSENTTFTALIISVLLDAKIPWRECRVADRNCQFGKSHVRWPEQSCTAVPWIFGHPRQDVNEEEGIDHAEEETRSDWEDDE